ncbi:hypothetical protein [Nonomuraea turcica]|uniref:hypothetical protein n=1 Tax=Nonomuraea sp. G32 TaxID=3067274 RepID=UPI00273C12BB|nr:hypothetical protein [Nonomuraea sp. G32]MDP4511400.1 hypothetical protein [Nonomuraea sp. G32]
MTIPLLSSIVYEFAATEGDDPYTAGPLDLAAYATTGVMFVLMITMVIWSAIVSMRAMRVPPCGPSGGRGRERPTALISTRLHQRAKHPTTVAQRVRRR